MGTLKIEVGKTYETAGGDVVTIAEELREDDGWYGLGFRFSGDRAGLVYTAEGQASADINKSDGDLVKEILQTEKSYSHYYQIAIDDYIDTVFINLAKRTLPLSITIRQDNKLTTLILSPDSNI